LWEHLLWERLLWERLLWERLLWERLLWERLLWERLLEPRCFPCNSSSQSRFKKALPQEESYRGRPSSRASAPSPAML
jgi:hypothetical protein